MPTFRALRNRTSEDSEPFRRIALSISRAFPRPARGRRLISRRLPPNDRLLSGPQSRSQGRPNDQAGALEKHIDGLRQHGLGRQEPAKAVFQRMPPRKSLHFRTAEA
jgi:hypothetical protein